MERDSITPFLYLIIYKEVCVLLITDADRHALQFFLCRSLQRATLFLQGYLYKVAVVRGGRCC